MVVISGTGRVLVCADSRSLGCFCCRVFGLAASKSDQVARCMERGRFRSPSLHGSRFVSSHDRCRMGTTLKIPRRPGRDIGHSISILLICVLHPKHRLVDYKQNSTLINLTGSKNSFIATFCFQEREARFDY
jgi:hypothetical protein